MRNFTQLPKVLFRGLGLLGLLFSISSLSAQSHTLKVSAPANIVGEYGLQIAGFGPAFCETDDLSGDFILLDNGSGLTNACDTTGVNDLTGKIAIIDRGGCDFSTKIYNAQLKGAIAAIVCDVTVTSDYVTMSPGANANLVTIPSFFMLKADCDIVKSSFIDGGPTAVIDRNDVVDDFDGVVFYEETFGNGLNGWTVNVEECSGSGNTEGVELWKYKADGIAEDPCGGAIIPSPTRCDGAVAFESSLQDSGGGDCGEFIGQGPCPSPHIGTLTSPTIDLSGASAAGFSVRFHQVARRFISDFYLGWSYDGGVTWDSTLINEDVAGPGQDSPPLASVESFPLPNSIDASSVKIRFRMETDYYYWIIDDVQIVAQEANNLQVNSNFFAIPPNLLTPVSQTEPFGFLADIENVGSAPQDNVNLNMTIVDTTFTNILFTTDLVYNTVPANTIIENVPFAETYTPTEVGQYFGLYDISSDAEDVDESNNAQLFTMAITDNLFAKEVGPTRAILPAAGNWDDGEAHSWAFGNYFYVPNGEGYFVDEVSFGLGNPGEIAGQGLVISLYEWTGDTNNDGNMDPTERQTVAFGLYTVLGTEQAGATITVPFPGDGLDRVALKDETAYVLMLEFYAPNAATDMVFVAADDLDYGASVFVSSLLGAPRYAALLGINGDLTTEPYSTVTFTGSLYSIIPVARMSITSEPTKTENLASIRNEFAVFPNPAKERINLQMALQEQAKQMTVRLMDVSGRIILQRDYENIQREFLDYDVSKLAAGTYFLQVTTNTGTGTKKFMKSE